VKQRARISADFRLVARDLRWRALTGVCTIFCDQRVPFEAIGIRVGIGWIEDHRLQSRTRRHLAAAIVVGGEKAIEGHIKRRKIFEAPAQNRAERRAELSSIRNARYEHCAQRIAHFGNSQSKTAVAP
jgi:hypothetical protein